ncbi:MAG: hypothetical protein RL095_3026 [Verrucomicrobiota bacterium]|jgi:uncharacterized membrane protein
MIAAYTLWDSIGPFHILLLHLPIGVFSAIALIESLALFSEKARKAREALPILYVFAAATAVLSVITGLSLMGDKASQDMILHRNFGIATAILACIAAALSWKEASRPLQLTGLALVLAAMTATGHLGGGLSHGDDFLTEKLPDPLKSWLQTEETPSGTAMPPPGDAAPVSAPVAKAKIARPAFQTLVMPIFEKSCTECHGASKVKGKLRLDSYAATLKGGDTGPSFVARDLAQSLAWEMMNKDIEDEEVMPPKKVKCRPDTQDLARIKWWIENGLPDQEDLSGFTGVP